MEAYITHVSGLITTWQKEQPALHFLLSPLQQWLSDQVVVPLSLRSSISEPNASKLEQFINSLLVCTQTLASRCSDDNKGEESDEYILNGYIDNRDFTHLLHLDEIKGKLTDLIADLSSWSDVKEPLSIITPFLDVYLTLAQEQLLSLSNWTKAFFKLSFVLCSLLLSLCQVGFCKPPDIGDEDDACGGTVDATGGVGIGDGLGTDNVSKEIEDESQIEGLRGEEIDSKEEQSGHDEGDAIEVNDDFGGELEDFPEQDTEEDDRGAGEEQEEFDETLGNLDPLDPSAIDEKMWSDKQGSEGSDDQQGEADTGHSEKQKGSSELVAKDGKERKKSKESLEERTQEDVEVTDQEEIEAEDDSNSDPNVNGAPLEHIPDANTLDLPDDIDLGLDDIAKQGQVDESEDEDVGPDGESVEEMNESTNELPSVDHQMDTQESPDPNEDNTQEQAEEDGSGDRNDVQNDAVAHPDLSKGTGTTDPQNFKQDFGTSGSDDDGGTSQFGNNQNYNAQEFNHDNKE